MSERSGARSLTAIFALALGARLAVVAWAHGRFPPTGDGHFYHRLATRIAAGEGYTWLWPDGSVTAAAHYPVGYPALIAGPYALFGPSPTVAMVVHALVGALGCVAVAALVARCGRPRASVVAGVLAALHPALLAYTPAMMTEGVVGSLLALASWATMEARQRRSLLLVLAIGAVIGAATLVRPQVLLLAPAFGALVAQGLGRRIGAAALVLATALAICAPWTARNCVAMKRCALVSVNGGWNLLIGTDPRGEGSWTPLEPPEACRTVWDEAAKDTCFQREALKRIASDPIGYLSLAPAKIAQTFDHGGAPGWYLHDANPSAFGAAAQWWMDAVETVTSRLLIALCLIASLPRRRPPRRGRDRRFTAAVGLVAVGLVAVGLVAAATIHAAIAFLVFATLALALHGRTIPIAAPAMVVIATALVHAVVFGGGRYQLVLYPLLAAPAALGALRLADLRRGDRRVPTAAPSPAPAPSEPPAGERARS